jgi:hypothetical protein
MCRKPRPPLLLAFLLISVHFSTVPAWAAGKKKPWQEFIRPNQVFELPDAAAKFGVATKGCANDVWAAAVATVLEAQQLKLPAKDWSIKLAGGDACLQALPELESLRKSVAGDYVLGNGRQVRITMEASAGPPQTADPLGAYLAGGQPLIVIYKGQPLLLYGMTYDEHIINNLRKELWITELRLIDPAANVGTEKRTLLLKREGPEAADIEAIVLLKVTPMEYGHLEPH